MKKFLLLLTFICFVVTGCSSKKVLSEIQLNSLESDIYTEDEWNQMLDEFVTEFNEKTDDNKDVDFEFDFGIDEITYVGDKCLKMEIEDWYKENGTVTKDEQMDFMLLKVKMEKVSLIDKLNISHVYPEYYYFVGKKQNEKWKVLRFGMAIPVSYGLQCELQTNHQ